MKVMKGHQQQVEINELVYCIFCLSASLSDKCDTDVGMLRLGVSPGGAEHATAVLPTLPTL